ncbi:MAG: HAD family phosphatase, partial [Lachnospiraceae bacterium]|nr:HAD family phosphatase [Lachnospiraceae bacterium]
NCMASVKLIGIDLDGTLLNSSAQVSEGNRKAIKEAQENGITVVPVTGRAFSALPAGLTDIEGIEYIISGNGATVTRLSDMEVIRRYALTREQTVDIVGLLDRLDCETEIYFDGTVYACLKDIWYYGKKFDYSPYTWKYLMTTRTMVDNMYGFTMGRSDGAELIAGLFGDLNERQRVIDYLKKYDDLSMTEGMRNNIEITHMKAQKGAAFSDLAEMLGIGENETAAFGDNYNDIDLLDRAAHSICMGNGKEEVKKRCDMVTLSNNEDGVAYGIKKLLEA